MGVGVKGLGVECGEECNVRVPVGLSTCIGSLQLTEGISMRVHKGGTLSSHEANPVAASERVEFSVLVSTGQNIVIAPTFRVKSWRI